MPVIDPMRKLSPEGAKKGIIPVQPFHTGHLGFIPGTPITVRLMRPSGGQIEVANEITVTTLAQPFDLMFRLECLMIDKPGVVLHLLEAVWALGLNVERLETVSINYALHHEVNMTLSWNHSMWREPRPTPAAILRRYAYIQSRIPIHEYRYVLLYESIMSKCGEVIRFDKRNGDLLPVLFVNPFPTAQALDMYQKTIERATDSKAQKKGLSGGEDARSSAFRVKFEVPKQQWGRILAGAEVKKGDPIYYILNSDANTNSLRVFFPKLSNARNIVHISFIHRDFPGALVTITDMVAKAEFNILTSILRRTSNDTDGSEEDEYQKNEFEILAEYQGQMEVPRGDTGNKRNHKQFQWIVETCRTAAKQNTEMWSRLQYYGVEAKAPRYPLPASDESYTIFQEDDPCQVPSDAKAVNVNYSGDDKIWDPELPKPSEITLRFENLVKKMIEPESGDSEVTKLSVSMKD